MYCRECGEELNNPKAVICIKCGTNKGQGKNYCPECGDEVKNKDAEVCLSCGVRLKNSINNIASQIMNSANNENNSNNNKLVAGLLAIFLGSLGVHRFYLGYKEIGFIQLGIFIFSIVLFWPTMFACWIWELIDVILIFTDKLPTANGVELV